MGEFICQLPDLAATQRLAASLAGVVAKLPATPITIALSGTLGAGKTQWVRFFCEALGIPTAEVTSPTYVLLQRYTGDRVIYHFDFYRLDSEAQVWDLGIDEIYEQPVIVLIEWADKFFDCLPEDHLRITFEQLSEERRSAKLEATGPLSTQLLTLLGN